MFLFIILKIIGGRSVEILREASGNRVSLAQSAHAFLLIVQGPKLAGRGVRILISEETFRNLLNLTLPAEGKPQKGPQEHERKFLVAAKALPALDNRPKHFIDQGYLITNAENQPGSEMRIRAKDGSFYITVKSAGNASRGELEFEIQGQDYQDLRPACENRTIMKVRYEIKLPGGLTAELDQFKDQLNGRMLAEVEFPSKAAAKRFNPSRYRWIGKEVTDDKRYKNKALAVNGWPQD